MNRNITLDILKVLMSLMVVGLHSGFLYDINQDASYMTVNGVFRIAVPMFLVINGYYFFNITNREQYITWLFRIGALYCFWMLFYSFFWFKFPNADIMGLIKFSISIVVGYWHLWYLSGLIMASIMLFALRNNSHVYVLTLSLSLYFIGSFFSIPGTTICLTVSLLISFLIQTGYTEISYFSVFQ